MEWGIQYQIQLMLEFLGTPQGMLAVALFVLMGGISLIFRSTRWVFLSFMLFASTLSVGIKSGFIFPIEQLQSQGRPVTIAFMILLMATLLIMPAGWRRKYFVIGALFFLIFQVAMAMITTVRVSPLRGASSFVLFVLIFVLFSLLIPRALQGYDGALGMIRGMAGLGIVFVLVNVAQTLVNHSLVADKGRFSGTTQNAQLAGQITATALLPMLYLMVRKQRSKIEAVVMGGMAALAIIMLVWSGSRGGVLMALVGVALLFRVKLGRLAVGGAVVAIFVMLAVTWIFPEHNVLSEHLLSTEDTRTGVWLRLWGDFLESPLAGRFRGTSFLGEDALAIGESSYLSIAARFGLVCLIPFGLSMFYIARASLRLERSRREFADVLLPDLVNAGIVQILLGAVFEGYLLGVLSAPLLMLFGYLALLAFLLEWRDASRPHPQQELEYDEEEMEPAAMELSGHAW